jgi:tetratricopeptide (TPR) repeat protein
MQLVSRRGPDLNPSSEAALHGAIEQAVGLLRWNRDYSRALKLLADLRSAIPLLALRYDLDDAALLIAQGDVEAGLENMRRMIDSDPGNLFIRSALGVEFIGLGRYDEAEESLQAASALNGIAASDRAQVYWLLFDLYRRKPQLDRAEEAWLAACRLDPALTIHRPKVIRAFIYWRHFQRAAEYIRQDTNEARASFFTGLSEFNGGRPGNGIRMWRMLVDNPFPGIEDCPDEYAEACLYLNQPRKAVDILRPLVDKGEIGIWRLLLLGLAYALIVDVASAKHFLNISLRLADTARPRESRNGAGNQVIHGGPARVTYGQIITATDLQAELDAFFIPLPQQH